MFCEVRTTNKYESFVSNVTKWGIDHLGVFPWRFCEDSYKILITEILLVRTSRDKVNAIWQDFFARFPTISALAKSTPSEISSIIHPLGLQRIRASQILELAIRLVEELDGIVPLNIDALARLKGVGQYVASATICFLTGEKTLVIDSNINRVIDRFFAGEDHDNYKSSMTILERILPLDNLDVRMFYFSLIDLGYEYCRRVPDCEKCVLRTSCSYNIHRH